MDDCSNAENSLYCGENCGYIAPVGEDNQSPPFSLFIEPIGPLASYMGDLLVDYGNNCIVNVTFDNVVGNDDVWTLTKPDSCTGNAQLNPKVRIRPIEKPDCPDANTSPTNTDPDYCQLVEVHTSCSFPIFIGQCFPSGYNGTLTPSSVCQDSDPYQIRGYCNGDSDASTCFPSDYVPLPP